MDFPCGSAGKESTCNAGDLGLIPGLGRSPGEGKGYPLQYSGLQNSMDCIVHGVTKSGDTTEQLSLHFTSLSVSPMSCSLFQAALTLDRTHFPLPPSTSYSGRPHPNQFEGWTWYPHPRRIKSPFQWAPVKPSFPWHLLSYAALTSVCVFISHEAVSLMRTGLLFSFRL